MDLKIKLYLIFLDIKERWWRFSVENDLEKIEKDYKDKSSLIINEKLFEEKKIILKYLWIC